MLTLVKARFHTFAAPESTLTMRPVLSPSGANSTEPQIAVQGVCVILSWLETSGASYGVARDRDELLFS
jgi:hypothetical protein